MTEYLATDNWHDVGAISLDVFVWIEHYFDRGFVGGRPMFEERFDLATFALASPRVGDIVFQDYELVLRHPKWRHMDRVEVEQLIGEAYVAPELDDRERG